MTRHEALAPEETLAPDEMAERIRDSLLPLVRDAAALAAAVHRQIAGAAQGQRLLPVADRCLSSAQTLERMVEASIDDVRAQPTPAGIRRVRHDLRNPTAAVRGFAELLSEDLRSTPQLAAPVDQLLALADEALEVMDQIWEPVRTAAAAEAAAEQTAAPHRERSATSLTARILVVDDDEAIRALVVQQLRRERHDPVPASSGEEALRLLRQSDFDLVLLDLNMPGMDGEEVLKRIVSDPRLRETPVIMVSSAVDQDNVLRCIESGAIDYLLKPVKPVILRARLTSTLARKRWRDADRHYRERLELEKRKSDSLLLNILPRQTVMRLSAGEDVIADAFDDATVLFSDFVGFTRFAAALTPRQVVEALNRVFSEFDRLVVQLNVEKIKMIGDAYMAAAGVPMPRLDHAEAIADLALGMQRVLTELNPSLVAPLQMRVGVASGPVVAGVIGTHKFAYDVWGHTVNMASRHESYCEPGRIHVSVETADRLRDKYVLESRGIMNIRGRGDVETFFLLGKK